MKMQDSQLGGLLKDIDPFCGLKLRGHGRHLQRIGTVHAVQRAAVSDFGDQRQGARKHQKLTTPFCCKRSMKMKTSLRIFSGSGRLNVGLQFLHNLQQGVLAVAAFQNFASGALQSQGAFRKQQRPLLPRSRSSGTPVAKRGWLDSSGCGMRYLLLGMKGAGRRPSRLHVGIVDSVELRPKNFAFFAQRIHGQFLLGAGLGMLGHIVKREVRVRRRLLQARLEIIQIRPTAMDSAAAALPCAA